MHSVQRLRMTGNSGVFGVSGAAREFGVSREEMFRVLAGVFGMPAAGVYANEVNHAWIVPLTGGMA